MQSTRQFLESLVSRVNGVARETVECLGEEQAHRFSLICSDSVVILHQILGHYSHVELSNLVYVQLIALPKELTWLQFLFLAGNYPLVTARLRYLWEAMFRAYFVETHEDEAVRCKSLDEKLQWIDDQKPRLDWKNCIQPTLARLLASVNSEADAAKPYRELWQQLNQYVHPSQYLQCRLVQESSLLVADRFDQSWAADTVRAGLDVADLIWLPVLELHDRALVSVAAERLSLEYRQTSELLARHPAKT